MTEESRRQEQGKPVEKLNELEKGVLAGITRRMEAAIPQLAAHRLEWLKKSVSLNRRTVEGLIESDRKNYLTTPPGMRSAGERQRTQDRFLRTAKTFMDIAIDSCVAEGCTRDEAEAYVAQVFADIDTSLPEIG